jgi:hypothetical protein
MTDLVVDKIATAIENDEYTIGIFLDLYNAFDTVRGVAGKHQKIGGAPASRGTLGYRKGHLKNFSQKCWGGEEKIFPS